MSRSAWLSALSQVNLNYLLSFAHVADQLSFRVAAERMHLSQSAISVQIRELEARLGVPLFHRTTRHVSLTGAGKRLLDVLDHAGAELGQVARELRGEAALQRGLVKVAAVPSLAASLIPRITREFSEKFGGIRLQLMDVDSGRALAMLQNAQIDVAVLSLSRPVHGVEFVRLFGDELVAVVGTHASFAQLASPLPLSQVQELPLLLSPRDVDLRDVLDRALASQGLAATPVQEVSSAAAMVALASEGLGVAILARLALRGLDTQGCVTVPLTPRVERTVGLALQTGRSPSPALLCFCAFLQTHAERISRTLSGPRRNALKPGK